ncbi:hypothetical protein EJ110_NYTH02762 [Nymphaea thermarum]|nr:hypothetical protein EJ110_NYTH02762 [Nymphaea thermarum]
MASNANLIRPGLSLYKVPVPRFGFVRVLALAAAEAPTLLPAPSLRVDRGAATASQLGPFDGPGENLWGKNSKKVLLEAGQLPNVAG